MDWIPDIPGFFTILQRIQNEEDLLKDSVDIFWSFCISLMNHEQYIERMDFWRKLDEKNETEERGFTDSELESIMYEGFKNPDSAAISLLEKFDMLIENHIVDYIPDSKDAPTPLFVYIHLEAARLNRLIKVQGYSETTRDSITKTQNALERCFRSLKYFPTPPWQYEYLISLEIVASFLATQQYYILKIDGQYQEALEWLIKGLDHVQEAYTIFDKNRQPIFKSRLHFWFVSFSQDFRGLVPWLKDINQQVFVEGYEVIKKGKDIQDTENLIKICESFLNYSEEPWLSNQRPDSNYSWIGFTQQSNTINNRVETENYEYDSAVEYWRETLGWTEAQVTPSQYKKLINEREEEAAERRLKEYFFDGKNWDNIPDRAKSSLISADRDWFSGTSIRKEVILNHLAIATEEILYHGLWMKLDEFSNANTLDANLRNEYLKTKQEMLSNRIRSKLRILADFCREPLTGNYLSKIRTGQQEKDWFQKRLPGIIHDLYNQRNNAEHELEKRWKRDEIGRYYREFIGIGSSGILPRLVQILFK
ncbi:MAG: hypothetical protein JW915_11335 [Chitinispirillaceae bacterium]|nr:hypothetical protein [Chitinispirillaceae bacterium]